jgi:hypothetical protein
MGGYAEGMSAAPPTPRVLLRRPWLPTLLLMLLWMPLYGGRAFLQPLTRQLGSATSEGPIHLWSLWTVAETLWSHGPLVRVAPEVAWPEGFMVHLMDPVSLLLFLPGYWLGAGGVAGASLGWNLLHGGAVLLAAFGAYRLARALDRDPVTSRWTAALAVAAFAGGSFLVSHPWFGRTEILALVLMPWHLASLLPFVQGRSGWKAGLGAGLLLGAVALGGGYPATFALLLELPLALWLAMSAGAEWRRVLARLGLVAAVALLVALPWPLALLAHPPASFGSVTDPMAFTVPPLRWIELRCALRLGHPGPGSLLMDQPVYPGVALLGLAILGAALRPRKALPWLLLGLWLLLLALGQHLDVGAGERVRLLSGWLVQLLPPLHYIKFWSRLGVLIPLPLAVAASLGLRAVLLRCKPGLRPLVGVGVVALVLADQATWPRPWSARPVFQAAMPAELAPVLDRLPPGGVLQVPLEVPSQEAQLIETGFGILWQLQHGRPVTATPAEHGDESLRSSNIARFSANLQGGRSQRDVRGGPGLPGQSEELTEAWAACLRADAAALLDEGISGLVLHLDRPDGPALGAMLSAALGAPQLELGTVQAWDLEQVPAEEPCALFGLVPTVGSHLVGRPSEGHPSVLILAAPGVGAFEGPRLRELGERGAQFERALPSRPDLERTLVEGLRGQLGAPGVWWDRPWSPAPAPSLPELLEEAGYRTVAWAPGRPGLRAASLGFHAWLDESADLEGWIAADDERPFLALLVLPDGADAEEVRTSLDLSVGLLAERGGLDDALVVVLTTEPAAEADPGSMPPTPRAEWLIAGTSVSPGSRLGNPVSSLDLAPTLAELSALSLPVGWHGRSRAPSLLGGVAKLASPPVVVVNEHGASLVTPEFQLVRTGEEERLFALGGEAPVASEESARIGRLANQLDATLTRWSGVDLPVAGASPKPPEMGAGLERLTIYEEEAARLTRELEEIEELLAQEDDEELIARRDELELRLGEIEVRSRPLRRLREELGGGGEPQRPPKPPAR